MRTSLFFLFLFVLMRGHAQSIVAGEFDANEFYYDFVPNHLLLVPDPVNFDGDSLYIDMNNDGIDDVWIQLYTHDGGNWSYTRFARVSPLGNTQIAGGVVDTCFANCPPPDFVNTKILVAAFDSTELINANTNWTNSSGELTFNEWNATVPNTCGYTCTGGDFGFDFRYIGIRVFAASDTLYGWIKARRYLTTPGENNLSIDAYACNAYVVGLEEHTPTDRYLLKTFDVLGRETEDRPNMLLIRLYSDGSTEKVVRIE